MNTDGEIEFQYEPDQEPDVSMAMAAIMMAPFLGVLIAFIAYVSAWGW